MKKQIISTILLIFTTKICQAGLSPVIKSNDRPRTPDYCAHVEDGICLMTQAQAIRYCYEQFQTHLPRMSEILSMSRSEKSISGDEFRARFGNLPALTAYGMGWVSRIGKDSVEDISREVYFRANGHHLPISDNLKQEPFYSYWTQSGNDAPLNGEEVGQVYDKMGGIAVDPVSLPLPVRCFVQDRY
jgi:hypothetical protein